MKVKRVKQFTRKASVYDFETPSHSYILGNGIISHNTMEMFSKAVVSGGCLEAGSKLQMSDGTLKNIEDILPGELVKTMIGDKEVTSVWNPETLDEGTPECIEIEFEDGHKIVCSESHKFLVDNNWVEAKDLNIKNIVSVV